MNTDHHRLTATAAHGFRFTDQNATEKPKLSKARAHPKLLHLEHLPASLHSSNIWCHRLDDFVSAYNFGRRLKTLKSLTPYEAICKTWINKSERFI